MSVTRTTCALALVYSGMVSCRGQIIVDEGPYSAWIQGVVSSQSKGAVADLPVMAAVFQAGCVGPEMGNGSGRTNASGAYRFGAAVMLGPGRRCVLVTVVPPGGTPIKVGTGEVDFSRASVLDSLRIDAQIP